MQPRKLFMSYPSHSMDSHPLISFCSHQLIFVFHFPPFLMGLYKNANDLWVFCFYALLGISGLIETMNWISFLCCLI